MNPAHTLPKRFAKVGGGAMKNASTDNNNWAQLVEQIELARAARQTSNRMMPEAVPAAAAPAADETFSFDEIDETELLPSEALFGGDDTHSRTESGVRSHLAWGIGGFFLGAVCWYFVGFWTFMESLVFTGSQQATSVERIIAAPERPRVLSYVKKRSPARTVLTSRHCTAFHRDPETGFTVAAQCRTVVRALGGAKTSER